MPRNSHIPQELHKLYNDGPQKKTFICIPGTQMTRVLIGKGLVLGGWPLKIEVIWVPGIKKYAHIHVWCHIYQGLWSTIHHPVFYNSNGESTIYRSLIAFPLAISINGNWMDELPRYNNALQRQQKGFQSLQRAQYLACSPQLQNHLAGTIA